MRKNPSLLFLLLIIILFLPVSCEKVYNLKDDNVYEFDTTIVVKITLNGNSITIEPAVEDVDGSKVTIRSALTIYGKGSLTVSANHEDGISTDISF